VAVLLVALCRMDLSFRGEAWVAHFKVPVRPAGEVGQEKGGDTHVYFLSPATSGVSTARARTSGLGSEPEIGTPRGSPSPESM
jgi:hypothetical protein